MARASSDLPLFAIGLSGGESVSSVWIGDRESNVGVIDVEILAGRPIQLVLVSYHRVVYRFSGETQRIARLTLVGRNAVGAIGIPAARIEIAGRCDGLLPLHGLQAGLAIENMRELFGRIPDKHAGTSALWRARIGSDITLIHALAPGIRIDPETDQLYRRNPGGLIWIDFSAVVSNRPVGRYSILPQQAGVRQLVMNGALIRATPDDSSRWEVAARARGNSNPRAVLRRRYGSYRVTRPVEIPAGLCGGQQIWLYAPSREYVLGNICDSTVYYDDGTGTGNYARPAYIPPSPPSNTPR